MQVERARLADELAEAREADNYWYDRYRCVVDRAEQAERERDRYREALERIATSHVERADFMPGEMRHIAREALED